MVTSPTLPGSVNPGFVANNTGKQFFFFEEKSGDDSAEDSQKEVRLTDGQKLQSFSTFIHEVM